MSYTYKKLVKSVNDDDWVEVEVDINIMEEKEGGIYYCTIDFGTKSKSQLYSPKYCSKCGTDGGCMCGRGED